MRWLFRIAVASVFAFMLTPIFYVVTRWFSLRLQATRGHAAPAHAPAE